MTLPIQYCLACGGKDLKTVLEMPDQPPANLLLESPDFPYPNYPLALRVCDYCSHGQLSHAVDSGELFGQGYTYASGTGGGLAKYFDWLADQLSIQLSKDSSILEIACNDGSLLHRLAARGFPVTGVEPDSALADKAFKRVRTNGADATIIQGFWPGAARETRNTAYKCILALNVLAHVINPVQFLKAAATHLHNDGIIIIQTSQIDMPTTGQSDSIYHEHISYFSNTSMRQLAIAANLHIANSFDVKIHGRSRIWILAKKPGTGIQRLSGEYVIPGVAVEFGTPSAYAHLPALCYKKFDEIKTIIQTFQNAGQKVILLGAAAKAITIMRACGVCPDHILDESDIKAEKWIPGWKTNPIQRLKPTLEQWNSSFPPPLFVLGAWNVPNLIAKAATAAEVPILVYKYFPQSKIFIVNP